MESPRSSVDELLLQAIRERRLIRLRYAEKNRIVEPHDYGIQSGVAKLLAYQVGGSSSGHLPHWRCLDVDRMSELELLHQTFPGGRPAPSGKHHEWDKLFLRVEPAMGTPGPEQRLKRRSARA